MSNSNDSTSKATHLSRSGIIARVVNSNDVETRSQNAPKVRIQQTDSSSSHNTNSSQQQNTKE